MLKTRNQLIFMVTYSSLAAIMFFIPNGTIITITPDGSQSSPRITLELFLFNITFLIITFITMVILSIRVLKNIYDENVARKFKFFITGVIILFYFPFGMVTTNYLDIQLYRQVHSILTLFVLIGAYLIYYGIGTELSNNKNEIH